MEGAERFQGKKNEYTIMVDCQFENKKLLGAYDTRTSPIIFVGCS